MSHVADAARKSLGERQFTQVALQLRVAVTHVHQVAMIEAEFSAELATLLGWADEAARLKVMANADTPHDAERALKFGAMGIGLARTERMFNAVERLPIVVEMIVSETPADRQTALNKLLPIQREDFKGSFRVMAPRPVTIRLLDPPIHEFLPSEQQLRDELDELRHLRDSVRRMDILVDTLNLLGKFDTAVTFFRRAYEKNPKDLGLLSQFITHQKFASTDDPLLIKARTAVDASTAEDEEIISLCFALGKIMDKLEPYDDAFDLLPPSLYHN